MTTLAERSKILADAVADPASPPAGSTQADVVAANKLLAATRQAMIAAAVNVVQQATPESDQLAWARRNVKSPDPRVDARRADGGVRGPGAGQRLFAARRRRPGLGRGGRSSRRWPRG